MVPHVRSMFGSQGIAEKVKGYAEAGVASPERRTGL
jgi:hypothetical protein